MKRSCFFAFMFLLSTSHVASASAPYDGMTFKGRIAYSADGNHNDEDDWAASPVALAILAECGLKDRLVHFDYNCILPKSDPEWEKIHATSVLGAAERYGYDKSLLFDCRQDLKGAVESISRAIDASSAGNPLYFIVAGPMEVPYLGIQKSNPEKRRFVYCISHSRWNDGFDVDYVYTYNKRSVIPSGIKWIQVRDQNAGLSTSRYGRAARPEEWKPWSWMRDSADENVRFLWQRMQATTRADCSDAGMAYFLATGDEFGDPAKLRTLLNEHTVPQPIVSRETVRLEAENFLTLGGFELEYHNDRQISHRINVRVNAEDASSIADARISTPFFEPYSAADARYDVAIRFAGKTGVRFHLSIEGRPRGAPWSTATRDGTWETRTVHDVPLRRGEEIAVSVEGDDVTDSRLDYVELALLRGTDKTASQLDDPDALTGQIIVAGSNPGYLKYNGGGPAFLSGPDNPEDFLFRGTLNEDGTRSGGGQDEMIRRMARSGVNAFHCQMFRMQRCNFKNEGDDTHCPFVDHDPSQPLDEDVLDQWDGWLDELEQAGVAVHLEFYNDATDVTRMGWTLDSQGNLHPDERRWIEGIVERFKHHRNILWGIEESCNKLPKGHTPHFKKIGEVIAGADNHNHPVVQSFVVPNDPEGDFPTGGITPDEYVGDPHIRVITWLHVVPHGDDIEEQHEEYLQYYLRDAENFVVLKNETFHHPRRGPRSRHYMWSCAMTGMHTLEAYHHADDGSDDTLRDDGLINRFMEQTDFYTMKPRDEWAAGSTKWVLANHDGSYIVYTYDYTGPMGLKSMTPGTYDLTWFDTTDGDMVTQPGVAVSSGGATWSKPDSIGNEVALYLKRQG